MKDETSDRGRYLLWAVPASLILHALAAALMVYGQARPPRQPLQEQAIDVALVPPPDPPKPKPAPAPPAQVPKAETPPEPKPEPPAEPSAEKPPPPEEQLPKPPQIEVLKPVFRFGEKDSGSRESPDGGSAEDSSPAPMKENDPKPSVAEKKSAESPDSGEPADATKDTDKEEAARRDAGDTRDLQQEATSEQGDLEQAKEEAEANDAGKESDASPRPLAADGGDAEVQLPASAGAPTPRPATPPKPSPTRYSKTGSRNVNVASSAAATASTSGGYSGLPGVRKLNSRRNSGDALAVTSMGDMPRDQRAARLCASELQQQLQSASYFPDLVPLVMLKAGNVLDVPDAAFRTRTRWYGLAFRCGVDADVTRVLSFTFQVGEAIPPEQWERLGLPVR
ncbi:MAG: DUF930 domain-containing protein [Rhizobiaceae bacterium]|nr:DUF930 domain-containing protein [Rhizobiaceae bacterium]